MKIELTQEQRYRAYELALDRINTAIIVGSGTGLCHKLQHALLTITSHPYISYNIVQDTFPEIFKAYKPADVIPGYHWWPLDRGGQIIRRDILLEVMANHVLSIPGLGKPTVSLRMQPFNGYNAPPRD